MGRTNTGEISTISAIKPVSVVAIEIPHSFSVSGDREKRYQGYLRFMSNCTAAVVFQRQYGTSISHMDSDLCLVVAIQRFG